ncbi:5-oxoprolinase subunit C family protein [Aestuariibaculum sediminum]|uniref:Biotin-dependent carboxyltransferase family protein n=1 Tax=Aestuariibaculum sediminum TaxID=2770637 RepID=A0A8J6UHD9_9FLAO|nr:biotin-dependent carboxyltransferase family protein [Aestuariibaculum sediminum]MBD0832756.1 biotin-dependent carboxyltransferase family protein [Aestuariibaculum sediminum]
MVRVLKPGFYSSIQDFGRVSFQHYGVPCAGVMDRYSAGMANVILGNPPDLAVLEMTITGASLQFECETIICLSGANLSPKINDDEISLNKPIEVKVNDVLSFGKLLSGVRCYVAVLNGFQTEKVLGSFSMYKGVTNNHLLSKNDVLNITLKNSFIVNKYASVKLNNQYLESEVVEVFKGPEFDLLMPSQQDDLRSNQFTVSKNNSRMAYQLEERLENNLSPIITSPVLPGTVQLTPSGQLIVLMRDCQTTGGYPRVLQLTESSIDVMAQKFTGDLFTFELLDEVG